LSATENDGSMASEAHKNHSRESSDFSAPLGKAKRGRLIFASRAQRLELTADPSMPDLYQARFRHYTPGVWLQENIITVEYRHFPFPGQPVNLREPIAEISLNSSIPWEIEFRRGASHLTAQLAQLQLCSLDILGGANRIRLTFSKPSGTTFIYVAGGVSQGMLRVPPDAEVRLQVSGGSSRLTFEDQRFESIEGATSLESPGFKGATKRYDISIASGTSHLTIKRMI
jgi:hypothetical protein